MSGNKTLNILECTLRDGSYVIDYQFTVEDTYVICLGLARAGFKFIEIGHGLGMGCLPARKGRAAATDKEYLQAAQAALSSSDAKYGMFFIPGIGTLDDLEMAAQQGMHFVRIGTNVNEIARAQPFIKKAKDLGFMVSSNLMKSYAVTIDEFKTFGKMADDFGVDVINVVDSAGGMMPDDVKGYVEVLKSVTSKDIGFHGHNNIQLAMANTLVAIEAGATFVDSSLQGMGRSAGNTQTEVLVMLLEKLGYHTGIDPFDTMDMGQRIVKTMMNKEQGVDDISLVGGIAQFHSSFMDLINEIAHKFRIDPRVLMLEVSKIDRVNVKRDLAERIALKVAANRQQRDLPRSEIIVDKNIVFRQTFENLSEKTQALLQEVASLSKKTSKESVFSLTVSKSDKGNHPFIRQSSSLVIANIEAADLKEIQILVSQIDGQVDWVLLDESCILLRESNIGESVKVSRRAWYSEDRVLLLSLCAFLSQRSLKGKVLVCADKVMADLFLLLLKQQGLSAVAIGKEDGVSFQQQFKAGEDVCAIVSFGEEFCLFLNAQMAGLIKKDVLICCARPGSFPQDFREEAPRIGLAVCRVDERASLASELNLVIETNKHIQMMGTGVLDGVTVVSGGIIGKKGSVIVDMVAAPKKVIGICDGKGGLLSFQEEAAFKENIEKVKACMIRNLYQ